MQQNRRYSNRAGDSDNNVDCKYAGPVFNRYPQARRYRDFRQMFSQQKDIDAVVVATPDHSHAVISIKAIKLGKHVFCVKPLARTVYENRLLAKAAREAKVATQVSAASGVSESALSDGHRRGSVRGVIAAGLVFLVVFFYSVVYAGLKWERKSSSTGDMPVPNAGDQQTCCLILDIDKDGINDFVIGERTRAPSVVWYKYNQKGWDRFVIDNTRRSPEAGGEVCDIDKDGDLDIILGQDASGEEIWWWENPYPDYKRPWQMRYIKDSAGRKHHDQSVADYDGDGQVELVCWNQKARKLLLFEIPTNPKSCGPWPCSTIYSWSSGPEHEGFASVPVDVDLDGKLDIVGAGRWFKHSGGRYKVHIIDEKMRFTQCAAGQLVKGGRPEVVFSPGDANGQAKWYQFHGKGWTAHTLRYVVHGHSCEVGDVDGDGNLDIFIGEMGSPGAGSNAKSFIWFGDGQGNFRETVISDGQGIHEGKLGDLDGDGDLDILMKPYHHNAPRIDVLLNGGEN